MSAYLAKIIPDEQMKRVLSADRCDIDGEFLGFTRVYSALSKIIPFHWDIIDLGCAYAPQAFYFKEHQSYSGVDIYDGERFITNNTKHYVMSIEAFIENHINEFDLETTFAICSYVPPWGADNLELTRKNFKNVFTYYPAGIKYPVLKLSQPKEQD